MKQNSPKRIRFLSLGLLLAVLSPMLVACGDEVVSQAITTPGAAINATSGSQIVNVPVVGTINSSSEVARPSATATTGGTVASRATARPPTAPPPPTAVPTPTPYPTPALKIPFEGAPKAVPEFKGQGQVTERQFQSKLLNQVVPYRIYLPAEYDKTQKRYPVLYMLHGFSGKDDEWMWYGLFDRLDEMIASGKIKPFIVVLPWGNQEYWVDHPDNGPRWGEYTAREVVAHIDGNFRTIPLKESRAIGGLSMGGNGALQVTMSYPNVFGVVGAHSPTMRTFDQKIPWWGDQAWFDRYDPITQAKTNPYLPTVKLWIDIGLDDKAWRARALELKSVLESRKINFTWDESPGDHNDMYWKANVPDYLTFYAGALDFK